MSSETILEFQNVWKKYSKQNVFHRSFREELSTIFKRTDKTKLHADEFWALKNISFTMGKGEYIGLYGPNGSGKSTILKLIASVTFPTKGGIKANGKVAPLIELGAGFHPDLTGKENIYMNGTIIGMSIKELREKMNEIINFTEIDEFINMPIKKFSSGMTLRLGFAIAIHSSAEILLLDEILSVGDEYFQKKCIQKIQSMKTDRKTIVMVSHNKPLLEKISDRIIFIKKGEITEQLNRMRDENDLHNKVPFIHADESD